MSKDNYSGFMSQIYDYAPYFKNRSELVPTYMNVISNVSHQNIMELGCATGTITTALATLGSHVDAVDLSLDMLKIARKHVENCLYCDSSNVEFIQADITEYTPKELYDVIVIPDSLLIVIDEINFEKVIEMCYSSLKKGGHLMFDVYIPKEVILNQSEYFSCGRFKDENNNTYIVEARNYIDVDKNTLKSVYHFKKRIGIYNYENTHKTVVFYHYKFPEQILSILERIGYQIHSMKSIFEDDVLFVSAIKI